MHVFQFLILGRDIYRMEDFENVINLLTDL